MSADRAGAEPIRGVLLDFAGTLFMPEAGAAAVRAATAALGGSLGEDAVTRLAAAYDHAGRPGGPYPQHVPAAIAGAYARRDSGPDEHRAAYVALLETVDAPLAGLAGAVYDRVREPAGHVPYADTERLLRGLRERGLSVALVSNIGFDVRPVVAGHGLGALIDACVLSFEVGATKPDGAIFLAACRALHVEPAQALMVGDHVADGGAADAGLRTLLLPMTPAGSDHGLDAVLRLIDAEAAVSR